MILSKNVLSAATSKEYIVELEVEKQTVIAYKVMNVNKQILSSGNNKFTNSLNDDYLIKVINNIIVTIETVFDFDQQVSKFAEWDGVVK